MGGVWVGSMMMKPIAARGLFGTASARRARRAKATIWRGGTSCISRAAARVATISASATSWFP